MKMTTSRRYYWTVIPPRHQLNTLRMRASLTLDTVAIRDYWLTKNVTLITEIKYSRLLLTDETRDGSAILPTYLAIK